MKVLILGISGMLGNALYSFLKNDKFIDVFGFSREIPLVFKNQKNIYQFESLDKIDFELINKIKPDYIINSIGVIKQRKVDLYEQVYVNSLFPHILEKFTSEINSRLIHISTDCVFSGSKGPYSEEDLADADDYYGRSKYLGEPLSSNSICIRTSIIGHELSSQKSLLGWFLAQKDNATINGYNNAIFSGVTTLELSKFIKYLIMGNLKQSGLYHFAGHRISKFFLLNKIKKIYKKNINIIQDESFVIDRSLITIKQDFVNYKIQSWDEQLAEMSDFYEYKES